MNIRSDNFYLIIIPIESLGNLEILVRISKFQQLFYKHVDLTIYLFV